MDQFVILTVLVFLGLCFGSFAGAQVWRLRAKQLEEDKKLGEEYDKSEYKRLSKLSNKKAAQDRSVCLSCGHQLAWYDLLPLFSWLSTAGKCRYCKKRIGTFEPLIEIAVATFFVVSYLVWAPELVSNLQCIQFALWLVSGVMLAILFAYDAKWFLLPDKIVFPLVALGVVYAGIHIFQSQDIISSLMSLVGAVFILSGIYLILWLISDGKWIGFGDVKLGLALGLFLGSWELALFTLFLANLLGLIVVLPGLAKKKMSRSTQIPFGPMLILAFAVAGLAGTDIVSWYVSTTLLML